MNRNRFFSFLILLSLVSVFSIALCSDAIAQPRPDRRAAQELIKKAESAYNQRNFRLAADQYNQAFAIISPTNPEIRFRKAVAHYHLNEWDQALTEFEFALKQRYKRPLEIYEYRWRIHKAKKNLDAAYADLQTAMRLDPQNVNFLRGLAEVSYERGSYDDAIDAYQKVASRVPNNADIYFRIAEAKASKGDAAGQLAAAEEAVKRRTMFLGESLALIADAYVKLGKQDEALEAYKRALSAKPDIYDGYRDMAEIYRSQGKFAEAIDISRKGLSVFPNDGNIYTDLAWYYSLADRHEEAVQAAEAGIRLLPDQHMAHTNLCRAYNDLNRPDRALTACNNALRISPADGETHFYLGRAYEIAGRRADAVKAYKKAVTGLEDFTSKNLTYSDGFYLLGNAYASDNQRDKAIAAYQKALDLSPRFARARYNLGIIQVLEKNKEGALKQYAELTAINPDLAAKLKAEIDKL